MSVNKLHNLLIFIAIALVSRREFFIRRRSGSQYDVIDAYALAEICLVGLAFAAILFSPAIRQSAIRLKGCSLGIFAGYCCFAVVTSPLSRNMNYSVFFAGEYLSQIVLLFAIFSSCKSPNDALRLFIKTSIAVTLITIGSRVYHLGVSGGLFEYKSNGGGACGAMLGTYCLLYFVGETIAPANRRLLIAGLVVGIGTTILTTSAASIISLCFGVSLASILSGRGKAPIILMIGAGVLLAVANPSLAFSLLFPGKDTATVTTLHGRTTFWEYAISCVEAKPFFGYGYAMAAKIGDLAGTNLHNSFLSVVVGNGIGGLAIFLVSLVKMCREAAFVRRDKIPGMVPAFAAMMAGLLNSNTLSFFGEDWRGPSYIFVSLWAIICVHYLSHRQPRSLASGAATVNKIP